MGEFRRRYGTPNKSTHSQGEQYYSYSLCYVNLSIELESNKPANVDLWSLSYCSNVTGSNLG